MTTPFALALEQTGRGEGAVAEFARAPDTVKPRRTRGRFSLAEVIFKALCLATAALLMIVFGIASVSLAFFLYLTY